jgi:hypothetical protein
VGDMFSLIGYHWKRKLMSMEPIRFLNWNKNCFFLRILHFTGISGTCVFLFHFWGPLQGERFDQDHVTSAIRGHEMYHVRIFLGHRRLTRPNFGYPDSESRNEPETSLIRSRIVNHSTAIFVESTLKLVMSFDISKSIWYDIVEKYLPAP